MDTDYIVIAFVVIVIIALVIWLVILKKNEKYKPLENPGVPVALQAECTSMGRGGGCGGEKCCKCDDWEGEKCVPRAFAKSACRNGKCDN